MADVRKTVVVLMGVHELSRYDLECTMAAGETEADCHSRIMVAAQARFEAEGRSPAEEARVRYAFAD